MVKISSIILNIGSVKYKPNIPPGYFMAVDTLGQVPYRPGGTSHYADYSKARVDVKLKFFNIGPAIFGKAGPERIGETVHTIEKSKVICKTNNLLRYFDLLCRVKHVADPVGLKLIRGEAERIKGKILFLGSWDEIE